MTAPMKSVYEHAFYGAIHCHQMDDRTLLSDKMIFGRQIGHDGASPYLTAQQCCQFQLVRTVAHCTYVKV